MNYHESYASRVSAKAIADSFGESKGPLRHPLEKENLLNENLLRTQQLLAALLGKLDTASIPAQQQHLPVSAELQHLADSMKQLNASPYPRPQHAKGTQAPKVSGRNVRGHAPTATRPVKQVQFGKVTTQPTRTTPSRTAPTTTTAPSSVLTPLVSTPALKKVHPNESGMTEEGAQKAAALSNQLIREEDDVDTDDEDCCSAEVEARRLRQREKQIQFGYNTVGYQRYTTDIPRESRTREHPRTPDKNQKCSKRAWDGQVRKWRRALHQWDTTDMQEEWQQKQLDAAAQLDGMADISANDHAASKPTTAKKLFRDDVSEVDVQLLNKEFTSDASLMALVAAATHDPAPTSSH
jgi:hypothetical protein